MYICNCILMQYLLNDEQYLFKRCLMDLDELVLGMAGEIVPAVIYKKKAGLCLRWLSYYIPYRRRICKCCAFWQIHRFMSYVLFCIGQISWSGFFIEDLLAWKSPQIEWFKSVWAEKVLTGKANITNLVKQNEKNSIV